VLTNVVQKKFETLQGDCLLAAALMIYLGQFTHQYREEYVNRWFHWIRHKSSIKISEYFDFIKLFGDKMQIQKWVLNKLPSDTFSISNALMIEMATQIQSIIIDP
jgi:dynein heavy chain